MHTIIKYTIKRCSYAGWLLLSFITNIIQRLRWHFTVLHMNPIYNHYPKLSDYNSRLNNLSKER